MEFNLSVHRRDGSRFRFNFFRQQQYTGIVIRKINTIIPTLDDLELPEIYKRVALKKRGLIIMASPGGSGKSTSMAAIIDHRNQNSSGHIITIEDPIEYVHKHKKCIITQREVGTDTESFSTALKNALRQRADVIAIGEVRDRESMEHAIRFAETGHLCIATIHSNNASQAIDRIVNIFPDDARAYILGTLSQNLVSIFSQRLVPNLEKGLSPAVEILLNEGLIKNLIMDDKINEIKEAMERSREVGMQSFDQSLYDLFLNHQITLDTAVSDAENPSALRLRANQDGTNSVEMMRSSNNPEDS